MIKIPEKDFKDAIRNTKKTSIVMNMLETNEKKKKKVERLSKEIKDIKNTITKIKNSVYGLNSKREVPRKDSMSWKAE